MADTYEQNLGQKSLVTADDYVRVVGTDNVSYKQQISSTPSHFKVISGTDLLGYIKSVGTGTYFIRMDNVSGLPSGGVVYRIVKTHGINDARCSIIAIPMDANASIYTTFITSASASSISWTAQPTRAEVDALNSKLQFANQASSVQVELPSNRSYITIKILNSNGKGVALQFLSSGAWSYSIVD